MNAPVAPRRSLLGRLWHLDAHGQHVDNVEGLCRSILDRASATLRTPLEQCDYDESLMFLLGEVWVQTEKYDAAKGATLGPFLHQRLGWRLLDYWEKTYGHNGEKRVVDLRGTGSGGEDDDDRGVRRLGDAAAQGAGDSPEAGADALRWLYDRGDRETLREERRLGLHKSAGTPDSDPAAGARQARNGRAGNRDDGRVAA